MITISELKDACRVIDAFCKEHDNDCDNCPMIDVCNVGLPCDDNERRIDKHIKNS